MQNENTIKKYRAKRSGFAPIKLAIKNKAVDAKMQKHLNRAMVLKTWPKAASGFVADYENQTKALDYQNGILFIACLSKELAFEIKLLARRIIEILNSLLGKTLVFAISIEI